MLIVIYNLSKMSFSPLCIRSIQSINNVSKIKINKCRNFHRAAFLNEFGKPLEVRKATAKEDLKPAQLRIRVNYCSLNRSDVEIIDGDVKVKHKLPLIPGHEFSGEVIEISKCPGYKSSKFCVGDQVVALCHNKVGGIAEEVIVSDLDTWKNPGNVKLNDATALILGHSTALLGFTQHSQIDEKSTILISAGVGGRGLAAVDVAANVFKSKVIGLYDSEDRSSLLREYGCFKTFKVDQKNVAQKVLEITNGTGVDLAYDALGPSLWETMVQCLKKSDKSILLEANPHFLSYMEKYKEMNAKSYKEKTLKIKIDHKILPINIFDVRTNDHDLYRSLIEETLKLCSEQMITPHISKEFKLDEVNEAIEFMKSKQCTGKVLINVQE